MTDEPENLTLKQLALLRGEMQAGFAALTKDIGQLREETGHKIGAIAQTLVGVQREIHGLKDGVATLALAVDEHTHRLDRIEKRLGLVEA